MRRKISLGWTLALVLVAMVVTFQATCIAVNSVYSSKYNKLIANYDAFEKLLSIDSIVRESYVGDIDNATLSESLAAAYIYGTGDKYGRYLNSQEFAEFIESNDGNSVGIGVQVIFDSEMNAIEVVMVYPDSPAADAGLEAGDVIVSVAGKSVADIGYSEAMSLMRGEEGTVAEFTAIRNGVDTKDYSITRAHVTEISAYARVYTDISGNATDVGVIRITEFNARTPGQFESAIAELKGKGVTKFIFDVRSNPGGELNSIIETLDQILPEGPIVRVINADGSETVTESDANYMDSEMVVLINGSTASAAELFAASVKDYAERGSINACLIGETTYGKGTMQNVINLGDGSAVSISTNMYNPPYSDNYEGVGVTPNIEVSLSAAAESVNIYKLSDLDDAQLAAAVEYLSQR